MVLNTKNTWQAYKHIHSIHFVSLPDRISQSRQAALKASLKLCVSVERLVLPSGFVVQHDLLSYAAGERIRTVRFVDTMNAQMGRGGTYLYCFIMIVAQGESQRRIILYQNSFLTVRISNFSTWNSCKSRSRHITLSQVHLADISPRTM